MAGKPLSVRLDDETRKRLSLLKDELGCSQSKAMERALHRGLAAFGYGEMRTETGSFLGDFALEGARVFGYGAVALFWATEQFSLAAGLSLVALVMIAVERLSPRLSTVFEELTSGSDATPEEADA